MAEGGLDLGHSVKESDYLHEFPCSLCERSGINVEAIKHCADCDENLCPKCLSSHNVFPLTRLHTVLDKVQTRQAQTKHLPSQRCITHGGKIIDVFCPKHDFVGCPLCISTDHSSCTGKKFISDVAAGIKTSKERKQLETEMRTLESNLDYLRKMKGDNIKRLKQDKAALKKEIKTIRKKINEQLDRMEKELEDEVDTKFKEKIDAIHASIAEVDGMLAKVKHGLSQVKSDTNDADIFVSCKIVKQEIANEIHPRHASVEELLPEGSFKLHTDEDTESILKGKRMFASLRENYIIQGVEYKEDVHICVSDDKVPCSIYAMCALPDGSIVIADASNMKLKTIDPATNTVSTLISLPDSPTDVCLVDDNRLAVSLYGQKKIQFVSLTGQVTLDKSFPVDDLCSALAHCAGLLYVCCRGLNVSEDEEGRGHVEVYTCNGELLRCFYEQFRLPEYISVIDDGYNTTMYISDCYNGVQVRDMDGTVKHRFPTVLETLFPFCLIGTDQLCIGERNTGNIYIQTLEDKTILLEKSDVKGEPICVYFDDRSSRLYIAVFDCDLIKVFKLKM